MNLPLFLSEWSTLSSSVRYREVDLFRELAKHLERHCSAVYVEELHGHPGMVKFDSKFWPGRRTQCELCDLVIVVLDPGHRDARVMIHQAKAHRGAPPVVGNPQFRFGGDIHQFELLTLRPKIESVSGMKFHEDLLQIGEHESYTSYGVFYHDTASGGVDYVYAAASRLTAASHARHPSLVLPAADFDHLGMCVHNFPERFGSIHLGQFVTSLLAMQIGEPVGLQDATPVARYLGALARRAARQNIGRELLDQLISNDDAFFEGNFRLLVVQGRPPQGGRRG